MILHSLLGFLTTDLKMMVNKSRVDLKLNVPDNFDLLNLQELIIVKGKISKNLTSVWTEVELEIQLPKNVELISMDPKKILARKI